MSLFRSLARGIKVDAIGPTNGLCNQPQDLYVGCKNNGVDSYICTGGGGGYNSKEKACGHVSVDCPSLQGGSPVTCAGVDPGPPTPPPSIDPTKYCNCRKSICGDDNDCVPNMSTQRQTILKNCCKGDQDCINYADGDISGFHTNPCGSGPDPNPPVGAECNSYTDCTEEGMMCLKNNCTPGNDYCNNLQYTDDNWTDQDKYCLYQTLRSSDSQISPDIANCVVKNIVGKYTPSQFKDLVNNDVKVFYTIIENCIKDPNFDNTACSGDSDCPSGQECKNSMCQKKSDGLSVGVWIAIGVAIIVVLVLIGFVVYKKHGTHHTGSSSLTRVAI
jgi:hypothetical protein